MADIRNLVRVTVNDAEDLTREVTTYAMRVYNTDNGWMSIIPFYRVTYQLNYEPYSGPNPGEMDLIGPTLVSSDFISEERINPDRIARCIRKNTRLPWVYHDTSSGRITRWQKLDKAHRLDDTAAFHIMKETYACKDCGKYARFGHVHPVPLCRECKEISQQA
jgi:hypothetical protein